MTHRVAVASHDGRYVDMHFAQADKFYIYDIHENSYSFVEFRKKQAIPFHDENEFDKTLSLLSDCTSVFVSRIGYGAAKYLASKGKRIFEAPYSIEAVLNKIVSEQILEIRNLSG